MKPTTTTPPTPADGPQDMDFTTCASCGAAILWAITSRGKRMPLDAHPSDAGTYYVFAGTGVRFLDPLQAVAISLTSDVRVGYGRRTDRPKFVSHFATCPNAAAHRKPRGPAR